MRYAREELRGDQITLDDLSPHILDIQCSIPAIPESNRFSRTLEDLPVRVRTRYGGRGGRRVMSAPTFDLVPSGRSEGLAFFRPPRMSHHDLDDLRLSSENSLKSFSPLSEKPRRNQKRIVPMPPTRTARSQSINSSYTNIIQMYSENSATDNEIHPESLNPDFSKEVAAGDEDAISAIGYKSIFEEQLLAPKAFHKKNRDSIASSIFSSKDDCSSVYSSDDTSDNSITGIALKPAMLKSAKPPPPEKVSLMPPKRVALIGKKSLLLLPENQRLGFNQKTPFRSTRITS